MRTNQIFHRDFKEQPFWWEAFTPNRDSKEPVPKSTSVAIVGAGYAGLATALELHRQGIEATVFDAEAPGGGASTRSGGLISGADSVKRPLLATTQEPDRDAAMMTDANGALDLLERLIQEENIDCGWTRSGLYQGAWSRRHLSAMHARAARINAATQANTRVVEASDQREHIGSDFYHGGLYISAAGHLHPALYYRGLLEACERRSIRVCGHAPVSRLHRDGTAWRVETRRGACNADVVVIATNGYTGDLTPTFKRRLIPLRAYIIATEPLEPSLAEALSPRNHALADSKRITSFFRLWRRENRMIYGSRMRWRDIEPREMAPLLFESMVARFPELTETQITHAWTGNVALTLDERPHIGELEGLHYALGCNGSGVANMTYLGTQVARRIVRAANYQCAFDSPNFPDHPLYNGNSRWILPPIGNYLRLRDWVDRNR
jgi:glycine/D-amino acid oxidase-like deaminating enzyme